MLAGRLSASLPAKFYLNRNRAAIASAAAPASDAAIGCCDTMLLLGDCSAPSLVPRAVQPPRSRLSGGISNKLLTSLEDLGSSVSCPLTPALPMNQSANPGATVLKSVSIFPADPINTSR